MIKYKMADGSIIEIEGEFLDLYNGETAGTHMARNQAAMIGREVARLEAMTPIYGFMPEHHAKLARKRAELKKWEDRIGKW